MHEMSIALSLIEVVRTHVDAELLPDVRVVAVRLGALAGVVPESLRFCFEAAACDSPLSGARLRIEPAPITGDCAHCGRMPVEAPVPICPGCGASLRLRGGFELELTHVECAPSRVEAV